jgi:serine/threonine protein kinase
VYEAEHLRLGSRVAMKVLRPELLEERDHIERFALESRTLALLDGDHVVRVLDAGRLETGLPYLVMELLAGLDLRTVMQRCPALPVELAVHYARQVCAGLASAHARGIVHGDIKPANLFLASDSSGHSRIKVIDFGAACSLSTPRGAAGRDDALFGSPPYAAPEQFASAREVDARTDVWGLGVVLFEMLAGRSPFDLSSEQPVPIRRSRVAPVRRWRPEVSRQLEAIIERCLDERKEMRFPTVQALSDALLPFDVEPLLEELETLEADPPPSRIEPARLCRLRRGGRHASVVREKARWLRDGRGHPASNRPQRVALRCAAPADHGSPQRM